MQGQTTELEYSEEQDLHTIITEYYYGGLASTRSTVNPGCRVSTPGSSSCTLHSTYSVDWNPIPPGPRDETRIADIALSAEAHQ